MIGFTIREQIVTTNVTFFRIVVPSYEYVDEDTVALNEVQLNMSAPSPNSRYTYETLVVLTKLVFLRCRSKANEANNLFQKNQLLTILEDDSSSEENGRRLSEVKFLTVVCCEQ